MMIGAEHSACVVTYIGTTPNIGTTLLALGSSVRLAERSRKRVAFLCLNLKSSKLHRYLGMDSQRISLDELLPDMRNESMTAEKLHSAMHRYSANLELYVLFGNRYRETAEYYGVEELLHLIEIARGAYDYVIIDANAYWDNAGTISALIAAESVVVATTEALSHFQEDYYAWVGMMGKHIQLEGKCLYHCVIKHRGGLFHGRQCRNQLLGSALPDTSVPISLYEALDRGELLHWLHHTGEGSKWLIPHMHRLFPELEAADRIQQRSHNLKWRRSLMTALSLHSKTK